MRMRRRAAASWEVPERARACPERTRSRRQRADKRRPCGQRRSSAWTDCNQNRAGRLPPTFGCNPFDEDKGPGGKGVQWILFRLIPLMARVLVVDDQPANVRILAAALRGQCEVVSAGDGATALAAAAADDVDLILLDVVLPDIDGFDVCRRLKANERTRSIPVIFVTSLEQVHDEATGFDVGGVDYITKPFHGPIVRARVRTHLELKHARDLLESLAMIDAVTGIANRRRFDEVLAQEWNRAVRSGSSPSIGPAGPDFFKKLNDAYGHARGDVCLRAVAQALHGVARRSSDLVARYGGEEFGLIVPESDASVMRP